MSIQEFIIDHLQFNYLARVALLLYEQMNNMLKVKLKEA